jgi:hypothetical protein
MTELPDLPEIMPADVSDDDLLLIYDNSEVTNKSRQATRAHLLKDVARVNAEANFTISEINVLVSSNATLANATIVTGLTFDDAATIETVIADALSVTTSGTSDGAGETVTKTVTGALTTDAILASFTGPIDDGVITQVWISAADTVSFRFFNVSGAPVAGDTYTANVLILRAS